MKIPPYICKTFDINKLPRGHKGVLQHCVLACQITPDMASCTPEQTEEITRPKGTHPVARV